MGKKLIIGLIVFLLLIIGIFIFYKNFMVSEEERYLFTDAPGEVAGKNYIDGEVFIIDENNPYFDGIG